MPSSTIPPKHRPEHTARCIPSVAYSYIPLQPSRPSRPSRLPQVKAITAAALGAAELTTDGAKGGLPVVQIVRYDDMGNKSVACSVDCEDGLKVTDASTAVTCRYKLLPCSVDCEDARMASR